MWIFASLAVYARATAQMVVRHRRYTAAETHKQVVRGCGGYALVLTVLALFADPGGVGVRMVPSGTWCFLNVSSPW
jgi:hypothetical protein